MTATSANSRDASVWSDLSAAYYETAAQFDAPELLADALSAADRALEFDPDNSDALFNRALIIEHLGLPDDARTAWGRYLVHDDDTGWSGEAREHLAALRAVKFLDALKANADNIAAYPQLAARIAAIDPFAARGLTIKEILGLWGAAFVRGDNAEADRQLRIARNMAVPVSRNGDQMLARAISAIDAADPVRRLRLAAAHAAYRDGIDEFTKSHPTEGEILLRRAAEGFRSAQSPMVLPALYFAANAVYEQLHHDEAERQLAELRVLATQDFPAYRAFVLWQLGVCSASRADWGRAIELYRESIDLFDRVNEPGNAACVRRLLAIVYDRIGDSHAAWQLRAPSLRPLGAQSNLVHEKMDASVADAAIVSGNWRIAASFLTLYRDLGRRTKNDYVMANTLFMRAVVRDRFGDERGSRADFLTARRIAMRVQDPSRREALTVAERQAAAMFAATSPTEAESLLSEAIEFQERRSDPRNVPALLLQRARARRATGNLSGAMADVKRGISELEKQRMSVPQGEMRWGAFHSGEELFDLGVELAIDDGDSLGAFQIAEQGRARALLESLGRPMSLHPETLPAGTTVVEYVTLPSRLVIFTATNSGVRAVSVPATRTSIATQVDDLRRALAADAPSWRHLSSRLRMCLIEPIGHEIDGASKLVFVTDQWMRRVPFGALIDPAGSFLLHRHRIAYAPSVAAFAAIAREVPRPRRPGSALVLTAAAGQDLPALAWVNEEARRIASLYPTVQRIAEDADQINALRSHAPLVDVIHLGGHAVGDERGIEPASIVLGQNKVERRVGVSEIATLNLARHPTVVIAGCATAIGQQRGAEGVISVAYGFLLAGAPSVISTLWPISDSEAAIFFPRLHRYLAAGLDPGDALRSAQIESIQRGDVPASLWAAVQDVGN